MKKIESRGRKNMRILIVEDEPRLADVLAQIMVEAKYMADVTYDGQEGLDYALSGQYDVIILDVMLPKKNGFEVVKELRSSKIDTPVIMLTARDDTGDKILGLDKGADDYMTKPFVPEELLARIRALSRRQGEVVLEELTFGDLTLQLSTNDLWCLGRSIHLGFKEFEILKILMSNPNAIISKEMLISKVWGADSDAEDNNVEAYISFIRKKLHFLNAKVRIGVVRKVGYRLEIEEA
jgi:DNA-binding response OmpR family regulator